MYITKLAIFATTQFIFGGQWSNGFMQLKTTIYVMRLVVEIKTDMKVYKWFNVEKHIKSICRWLQVFKLKNYVQKAGNYSVSKRLERFTNK